MWRQSTVILILLVARASAAFAQQPSSTDAPFALHLGPAYARVPDADFEVVGSLSGQDLFAQTSAREGIGDFGVFVSQRLWAAPTGPRLHATVGTGVSRPGSLLYLGGSVGISRALFTAGVATALVDSGAQPVPDVLFPTSQQRTVFGDVGRTRHWGLFVAGSIAVMP